MDIISEKVKVTPEGREGLYLVSPDEIIAHLEKADFEQVHTFRGDWPLLIGADWEKDSVIEFLKTADKIAFTFPHQVLHALVGVAGENRVLFDIGEIDESLMDIQEN